MHRIKDVEQLTEELVAGGHPTATALHGSLDSATKADVARRFRDGQVRVLVATSIAEHGVDVAALTHIVRLGLPPSPASAFQAAGRARGARGGHFTVLLPLGIVRNGTGDPL
eukprot:7388849-Prymnesium_polylepis.1